MSRIFVKSDFSGVLRSGAISVTHTKTFEFLNSLVESEGRSASEVMSIAELVFSSIAIANSLANKIKIIDADRFDPQDMSLVEISACLYCGLRSIDLRVKRFDIKKLIWRFLFRCLGFISGLLCHIVARISRKPVLVFWGVLDSSTESGLDRRIARVVERVIASPDVLCFGFIRISRLKQLLGLYKIKFFPFFYQGFGFVDAVVSPSDTLLAFLSKVMLSNEVAVSNLNNSFPVFRSTVIGLPITYTARTSLFFRFLNVRGYMKVGFMHGFASPTYSFYEYLNNFQCSDLTKLRCDYFVVWNSFWKEKFLRQSKLYCDEGNLVICDGVASFRCSDNLVEQADVGAEHLQGALRVLVVCENLSSWSEIKWFWDQLVVTKDCTVFLKIRGGGQDRVDLLAHARARGFILVDDLSTVGQVHFCAGSHSTLLTLIGSRVNPIIFHTDTWGDYFDLSSGATSYSVFWYPGSTLGSFLEQYSMAEAREVTEYFKSMSKSASRMEHVSNFILRLLTN